jgi:hypothetical protein
LMPEQDGFVWRARVWIWLHVSVLVENQLSGD